MIKENKSVLIIGTQRSGTNSLTYALNKQIRGEGKYSKNMRSPYTTREPWNYNSPWVRKNDTSTDWTKTPYDLDLIGTTNVVLKTQSFQKPVHFPGTSVEFMEKLAERFDQDRIIILCRKNYDEHIISYTNLRYKVYKYGYWTGRSDAKWKVSDIPQSYFENEEEQDRIHRHVTKSRQFIHEISDKLNIGISWHEDLYGKDRDVSLNLIKSWNLNIDNEKVNSALDPKYKFDQTRNQSLI